MLFIEQAVMKGIFSNSGHSKVLFYLMNGKGKPFFNSAFLSDLMYRRYRMQISSSSLCNVLHSLLEFEVG